MAGSRSRYRGIDDPEREISAYFVDNKEQLLAQTLLMCVDAVCLVAFASALPLVAASVGIVATGVLPPRRYHHARPLPST